MYHVYFATSREPFGQPQIVDFGANVNPLSSITFGRATVADASAEADLDQPVQLENLSNGTFWETIANEIVASPVDHLIVYLHGFDYTFRQTISRCAQLGAWYATGAPPVKSAIVCLSWPSMGRLTLDSYKEDDQRASGAGDAFRQFLVALIPLIAAFRKQGLPSRRVSLLAHSMGNHVLCVGLQSALGTGPGQYNPAGRPPLFDTIVLTASDEDADALSRADKLGPLPSIGAKIALYYNQQDVPLTTFSQWVHHSSRLGIDGPQDKLNFKGRPYTFVNCSTASPINARNEPLDPERHQYYRLVPEVRDDICGVMLGRADNTLPNRKYRPERNYYSLYLASDALVS